MEHSTMFEREVHTAEHSNGLLYAAFEDALQRAAAHDLKGLCHDDPDGMFEGLPATNVERVMETFEHYCQNREVMDAAVRGAMNFVKSPNGAAQVKALRASFESRGPNPLNNQIAQGIYQSSEFDLLRATTGNDSLKAMGIGVSAGAEFFFGALAGAEVLVDWKRDHEFHGRAWAGLSFELGIGWNVGLELSFWNQTPLTGLVKGWFIDLWVPLPAYPLLFGIRYMFIKQRESGGTEFSYAASSIQVPLDAVFPLFGFGIRFWAGQYAWSRNQRGSLSVLDATTQLAQITVNTSTSLDVTITNTSGESMQLDSDATLKLNMPWFFLQSEVEAMEVTIDDDRWTVTDNDGTTITLTLSSGYTWGSDDTIALTITGVECSGTLTNGQAQSGYVVATLDTNVSHIMSIRMEASLGLVWANFSGTLTWQVNLVGDDGFTMIGPTDGTTSGYAQAKETRISVTTAKDEDDNIWDFGYIFTYTTDNGQSVPKVCATMWKEDAPLIGKNYADGFYVVNEDGTSTAYYGGETNATSMEVTVALNS